MSVAQEKLDRLSPTERPKSSVAGYQHWRELLFLHWRVSPADAAALVPETLSIDTCEGSAWIGIVLFRMAGVRPWWSPSVPGISAFPETNVRTYVHTRGRDPGVWFLSLDAKSSLGVQLGRRKWGLPYYCSKMAVRRRGSQIAYKCERQWPGQMGVGGTVEAEIGYPYAGLDCRVAAGQAVPGSLEHFLIERYIMYSQKRGTLLQGRVHHSPYPLREAQLKCCEQSWLRDVGLNIDRPPDHVLFSEGVSTQVFPLSPVVAVP